MNTADQVKEASDVQLKPVTMWFHRATPYEKRPQFNHIEDGHVPLDQKRPTPKCSEHVGMWARGQWEFSHAWLLPSSEPLHGPRIVHYGPDDLEA